MAAGPIDLRSDTVTRLAAGCAGRWPRRGRRRRFHGRSDGEPPAGARRRDLRPRGGPFHSVGQHGEPRLPAGARAAGPGSHLRGERAYLYERNGGNGRRRGPPAALDPHRRRRHDLGAGRPDDPAEDVRARADRAGLPGEHPQPGRRHGLPDPARRRDLRRRATPGSRSTSTARGFSTPRSISAKRSAT